MKLAINLKQLNDKGSFAFNIWYYLLIPGLGITTSFIVCGTMDSNGDAIAGYLLIYLLTFILVPLSPLFLLDYKRVLEIGL